MRCRIPLTLVHDSGAAGPRLATAARVCGFGLATGAAGVCGSAHGEDGVKDPESTFAVAEVDGGLTEVPTAGLADGADSTSRVEVAAYRLGQWLSSPRPYLMLLGFGLFFAFWYLTVEVWKLPRFSQMPGPTTIISEWLSRDPTYGLSIYSPEYYQHIWVSWRRVSIAFLTFLASFYATTLNTMLGVESIDVSFIRAAYCLGARRRQVFWHVVVP